MKRLPLLSALAVVIALSASLTGCLTTQGDAAYAKVNADLASLPIPPQQIATQVCPPLESTLQALQIIVVDPAAKTNLTVISPIVAAVCTAGQTINIANLQALHDTGEPALLQVVQASPLDAADKNRLILAITAAHGIVSSILAQQAAIVIPAPAAK